MALLSFTLLATAGFLYLSRPKRLAYLSSKLLTEITGADVRIDDARFTLDGTISLRGVALSVPDLPPGAERLFEAQRVTLYQDIWSLLKGRFLARSLIVDDPTIFMTEDLASGKFNYQILQERRAALKKSAGKSAPGPATAPGAAPSGMSIDLPESLPEIMLNHAQARFGTVDQGVYHLQGSMHVSGTFEADAVRKGLYNFAIRQENPRQLSITAPPTAALPSPPSPTSADTEGFLIHGQFDLEKVALHANLDHFSFGSVHGNFLPRRLRQAWELVEPSGKFATVQFGYDPSAQVSMRAVFDLRDFQITLPVEPLRPKLVNVNGRVVILNDQIHVESLAGTLDQLPFAVRGKIDGFSPDSPFDLQAEAGPLEFSDKPAYVTVMPDDVKKIFRRFAPSGRFTAGVHVFRQQHKGPVKYAGTLNVHEASAKFIKFPYQLDGITGKLHFHTDGVNIENLSGLGGTGGRITIDGWIAPLTDDPAMHLVIKATDFPLDRLLHQAMPERRRPFLDTFFNQPAAARLAQRQLIQSTDNPAPATLPANAPLPRFAPGGRANFVVNLTHELGVEHDYIIVTDLDMAGLNMMFEGWPYPLRVDSGRLQVEPGKATVHDFRMRGLNGGQFTLKGHVDLPEHGQVVPHLELAATQIPIDELLLASIPAPQDDWVRRLQLSGKLDANGKIFLVPNTQTIDFDVRFTTRDAVALPFGGRYDLRNLAGNVTIGRGRVVIDGLQAEHGQSQLSLSGGAMFSGPEEGARLRITGKQMRVEDPVLDLIPQDLGGAQVQRVRDLIAHRQATGVYDAKASVDFAPDKPIDFSVAISPSQLALDHHNQRITLTDASGSATLDPRRVHLEQLGGLLGNTRVAATGQIDVAENSAMELSINARADRLEPTIMSILPENLVRVIRGMELDGGYALEDAKLIYRPRADSRTEPRFDVRGQLQLSDARATIGVPITQLAGRLDLHVTDQPLPYPRVLLKLDAQTLRIAKRRVSPLSLVMQPVENQPEVLGIQRLQGNSYGGVIVGKGHVNLASTQYRMELAMQDVRLDAALNPEGTEANIAEHREPGLLSASLTIEGYPGKPESRRGRGNLAIRDATLYNWPLTLAVLQLVNLSLPSARSIDRVDAAYLLEGQIARIDMLRLGAPNVDIVGGGTLRLDNQELDLTLHPRNPSAPKLGAFGDMLRLVKDELITIGVEGTLDKPKAGLRSFPSMRDSVRSVTSPGNKPTVEPGER